MLDKYVELEKELGLYVDQKEICYDVCTCDPRVAELKRETTIQKDTIVEQAKMLLIKQTEIKVKEGTIKELERMLNLARTDYTVQQAECDRLKKIVDKLLEERNQNKTETQEEKCSDDACKVHPFCVGDKIRAIKNALTVTNKDNEWEGVVTGIYEGCFDAKTTSCKRKNMIGREFIALSFDGFEKISDVVNTKFNVGDMVYAVDDLYTQTCKKKNWVGVVTIAREDSFTAKTVKCSEDSVVGEIFGLLEYEHFEKCPEPSVKSKRKNRKFNVGDIVKSTNDIDGITSKANKWEGKVTAVTDKSFTAETTKCKLRRWIGQPFDALRYDGFEKVKQKSDTEIKEN